MLQMLVSTEEKSNDLQFFKNKPVETNLIYLMSKYRNNLNENEEQKWGKGTKLKLTLKPGI